jgi:glyceraldehyde-3-phosphate dehydrogenase (NAD(P))
MDLGAFKIHDRIREARLEDGFPGNASFFRYGRGPGNRRGDMYGIGPWEDSTVESGDKIMYAIRITRGSLTIPETVDGIRAAMKMRAEPASGTAETNRYPGTGKWKK